MKSTALPKLIFMTDEGRQKDPFPTVRCLPSGSAVILRHYKDPARVELASRLINETRGKKIKILISGDIRLATKVGAQGIHIPEFMAQHCSWTWQNWRKPTWLITAAAHSPKALIRAKKLGAHAALLSPVFSTNSHPDAPPLGVLKFTAWCKKSPLTVYALGGVTQTNARRLKNSNIQGIAGISAFMNKY